MVDFKEVSQEEFTKFVRDYPHPLTRNVLTIIEPPVLELHDFKRAPYSPDSLVAMRSPEMGWFKVISDINAPVEDDGKRRCSEPLFDKNGVELKVGDKVSMHWGIGPPGADTLYGDGSRYDANGNYFREETICQRNLGTKWEHWGIESCHNIIHDGDVTKIIEPVSPQGT